MRAKFLILAAMLLVSMMPTVFAANATPGATTLTTNVPDAIYTLSIPADHTITFGATTTDIGNVTVTGSSNFAEGKNLNVTINYSEFVGESVSTVIPYTLQAYSPAAGIFTLDLEDGAVITFYGTTDCDLEEKASVKMYGNGNNGNDPSKAYAKDMEKINVLIDSTAWGKALADNYSSIITFTAEVVVEE